MKLVEEFTVTESPDVVWRFFEDVPAVASCLPGAELTEITADGDYVGRVAAKLGPMTASFQGRATITRDDEQLTGRIEGRGADRNSGSRASMTLVYTIRPVGEETGVTVDADLRLSGAIAQFGRTGLVREMSSRLTAEFVRCLESRLAAATPEEAAVIRAAEVRGLSLLFGSLASSLRRFIRRVFRRS